MNQLIINPGLYSIGDLLYYSPIPKIAKETQNYDKVLITEPKKNKMDSFSYKQAMKNIENILLKNPYVDGITKLKETFPNSNLKSNYMKNIIDSVILDDGLSIIDILIGTFEFSMFFRNVKPEIYIKNISTKNNKYNSYSFLDANSKPYFSDLDMVKIKKLGIDFLISKFNYSKHSFKNIINCDKNYFDIINSLNFYPLITIDGFLEYIKMMLSSKKLYIFTTGICLLAQALNIENKVTIIITEKWEEKWVTLNNYKNFVHCGR